jgi:hypothetical protein
MSRKLATTIKDSAIPGKYKRVAEAYAAFASNDGTNSRASQKQLGNKAGCSPDTVQRNTPDLLASTLLQRATSHTCKVAACSKGAWHFTGTWGRSVKVYEINIGNLQNAVFYLTAKCGLVNAAKCRKVKAAKCGTTQVLPPTPVSLGKEPNSSVLTDGKQASEEESSADADSASSRPSDVSQNQIGFDGSCQEAIPRPDGPQDRSEMYENYFDSPECDLLHRISPNVTDVMVKDQFPLCAKILSHFNGAPEELKPAAAELVLKYNRAHRGHKYASKQDKELYIKSAKRFLSALESPSATLMNDYDTHDFENCEICQNAGCGMHWREFVREMLAEKERQEALRLEAERAAAEETRRKIICPVCDKRERGKMTLGGFNHVFSGGLREVRETVCDQCYDNAYEYQQKHANMRVREVLSPRPEYITAKRKVEMDKLDAMEEDVPICVGCGGVSWHAKDCPAKAATA